MRTRQSEIDAIEDASKLGPLGKFAVYTRLSGPGWIQAAVTLGGGSLVTGLYLGVVGGFQFMWLQPLAMLCGLTMLMAISHVTLSAKDRPFVAVKKHVSPSLAWGWLAATVVADVVFCAAQFALGTDTLQNNLGASDINPYLITGIFAVVIITTLWFSMQEGKATAVIDHVLKGLVAIVVLAFMGLVVVLAKNGAIPWGQLFKGLIPDFRALFVPTSTYTDAIAASGDNAGFWTDYISGNQRNVIIGAFGAAVGINMTFLLPYSLKRKGWDRRHRELSRFDLVLGLFVPFVLATSCLVIATASQFHAKADAKFTEGAYHKVVDSLLLSQDPGFAELSDEKKAAAREALPQADKDLGVMLAKRDAANLATSLEPFLGKAAGLVFGIGVLAMALSTMIVHMMMNGYAISEAFGQPGKLKLFMIGAAMPAVTGFLSPIVWDGGAKTALMVPASVIATALLPIAYVIFLLLMNSRRTLGEDLPKHRGPINAAMLVATAIATFASIWSLSGKLSSSNPYEHYFGLVGLIALPLLFALGLMSFLKRERGGL